MKQILVVNLHSGRVRPPPYIIPQNQRKSNCIPQRYGASIMKIERTIAASRGRNPENPSDRKSHSMGRWKQRLECGGIKSNTLSTVDKDNYVVEYYVM